MRSCCEIEDALTFMTTVGAEICEACYSELELQSSFCVHHFFCTMCVLPSFL